MKNAREEHIQATKLNLIKAESKNTSLLIEL